MLFPEEEDFSTSKHSSVARECLGGNQYSLIGGRPFLVVKPRQLLGISEVMHIGGDRNTITLLNQCNISLFSKYLA